MIQICRKDKEKIYDAIRTGKIDAVEMSFPNLIDDIILTMKKRGLIDSLAQALPDKRRDNSHIPFGILLCFAVAAKLKRKTSLTDVPFAVTETKLLAELGWNLWDNERDVNEGLFDCQNSTIHFLSTVFSKTSSHFLAVLYLSQVSFRNIVIKQNLKIMKKKKMVSAVFLQPIQKRFSSFFAYLAQAFLFCFLPSIIRLWYCFSYSSITFSEKDVTPFLISAFLFRFILQSRPIICPDHGLPISSLFLRRYRIRWTLHSAWSVPK